ncbi:MAG: OadG family transporter subunit [Candidatus Gastranaerophilales bacterium]
MSENLAVGLQLLLIGMGTVLSFLCILVISMKCMSCVVGYLNKIFPEPILETQPIKVQNNEDEAIAVALATIIAKK